MKEIVVLLFLITGCNQQDHNPKLIRKLINNNDITIKWYYHSYVTDVSPDIIEISKNNTVDTILEAKWEITNVFLKDRKIIVRLHNPQPGLMLTKNIKKEIYGYSIILDSSGTLEERELLPIPTKEND